MSIGRIRLMLADDEASILEAMSELVSMDKEIDVVGTARDAGEAIDLAELHAPDVALLDVRMPGGGGSRAAREIRRRSPETRIVALSASTDPRTVASMVRAGAVGYVGKDQPADEVLRAIHRSADGRASLAVDRSGRGGGAARRAADTRCRPRRGADTRLGGADRGSDPRRHDPHRVPARGRSQRRPHPRRGSALAIPLQAQTSIPRPGSRKLRIRDCWRGSSSRPRPKRSGTWMLSPRVCTSR